MKGKQTNCNVELWKLTTVHKFNNRQD